MFGRVIIPLLRHQSMTYCKQVRPAFILSYNTERVVLVLSSRR